jgi:hypothetical protein
MPTQREGEVNVKIISIKHQSGSSDFGFAIVNDDMAAIHFQRCKTANHQGLFDLAMFTPDSPGDLLIYIRAENDSLKSDMVKEK